MWGYPNLEKCSFYCRKISFVVDIPSLVEQSEGYMGDKYFCGQCAAWIYRIWHGWITFENADKYEALLKN
jgi:hypothetical protein